MDVVTRIKWYIDGGKHRETMKDFDPYAVSIPDEVLQGQADQYARLFEIIERNADVVRRVTFWNLTDGQSWLNSWPWQRTNYPLLFARDRSAKPAYPAVIEAIRKN
jgi:endo-1,4-beta-xylanase